MVNQRMIDMHQQTVSTMVNPGKVSLYFAIMEIEAWFLGMYNLFQRIDSGLTVQFIRDKIGIDLMKTDPETSFYKPSDQLKAIYAQCGRTYDKRRNEVAAICRNIKLTDFEDALDGGRCASLKRFYQDLAGLVT